MIEKRIIPLKLLIVFGSGQAHETCKAGDFSGAAFVEGEAVIDTDTGEQLALKELPAKPLSEAPMVAELLGEKFTEIEAGCRAQIAAAEAKAAKADFACSEAINLAKLAAQRIAELEAQNAELQARIDGAAAHLKAQQG